MKDILGFDIVIGCFVAYPCRHGSHLWLTVAEVRDVDTLRGALTVMPVCDSLFGTLNPQRPSVLTASAARCVVVRNTVVNVRPFAPVSVPVDMNGIHPIPEEEEGHPLL